MINENYNIGLICDYTVEHFWKNIDRNNMTVSEAKQRYKEFFNTNTNAINESVDNYFNDRPMLCEGLRDRLEKNKAAKATTIEDGIPDAVVDATKDAAASSDPTTTKFHISVYNVSGNPAKKAGAVNDINFYTDCFYQGLVDGEWGDIFKFTDKILPPSLYDTFNVKDFTAVMAFKDLPNIDLSGWDVSNGDRFDGCFYKSTFNNASIKNWFFSKVKSVKNMFIGSDMSHQEVIDAWEPAYVRGDLPALPSLGKTSVDDSEEIMQHMKGELSDIKTRIDTMDRIKKDKMMYDENKTHRVMSSSEFINENFGDTMRKFGSAIKNAANKFLIKLKNGFVYMLDKAGLFFSANMPSNIVNFIKGGNVKGVYAEQGKPIAYSGNGSGYYDEIKKGDVEYNNYIEFLNAISRFGAKNEQIKVDEIGMPLDEAKVGLFSKERDASGHIYQNIGAPDVGTVQLVKDISRSLKEVRKYGRSTAKPMIVWGAPGIGKTSIPKTLVKGINEEVTKNGGTNEEKMAVIVVDCSALMAGDLSMPMPADNLDVSEIVKDVPVANQLAKEFGFSEADLKRISHAKSSDAPKCWLPVYKPTGDPKKNKLLDAIANGATTPIYDELGNIVNYESSGNGGILMFDEFLRADRDTLFGIAQLMMTREILSGYRLGSKWVIMGCSNRPTDDNQIKEVWSQLSPALKQRYSGVNFVPTYDEWTKWATEKGGFDDITLDFIGAKDPYGAQSRWHNIDPTESTGRNESRTISPRQWSQCIEELNRICDLDDLNDYTELGKSDFLTQVKKFLPDEIAEEYVNYYMASGGSSFKYKWDNIVSDPTMKVEKGTNPKVVTGSLTTYVRTHFSEANPPKPEDLSKVVSFLDANFPQSGNFIAEFIVKTYKYCGLDDKNYSDAYAAVYDKYNDAHPNLKMDELFETVGEI